MKAIVTVIGEDQVGITAMVCTLLAEHNINILDITQTVLQKYFTMVMLVDLNKMNVSFKEMTGVLEKAGGAKVLLEGEFDADSLLESIKELLGNHTKLEEMSRAMGALAVPEACDRICDCVLELLR